MVKKATKKKSSRRTRKLVPIESVVETLRGHVHISPSIKDSISAHTAAIRAAVATEKQKVLTGERLAKARAAAANAKTALAKGKAKAKVAATRELATAAATASRATASMLRKAERLIRTHHKNVEAELKRFAKTVERSASAAAKKATAPKRRRRARSKA